MKKIVLKYGALSALLMIVLFPISIWLGHGGDGQNMAISELVGWTVMVLSLSVIFLGIKTYRDKHLGGSITFGQGLKAGLLMAILGSLGLALVDIVYVTLINPDFFSNYMEYQSQAMLEAGKTQAEVDAYLESYESFQGPMGPLVNALVMFLSTFMLGGLISLLAAAVMKKAAPADPDVQLETN